MKKTLPVIALLFLLSGFSFLTFAHADTPDQTYPIYGGWNDYDTYATGWTAGSDNVVWDFTNSQPVYRKTNSLSLNYNPKGEFHMNTAKPLSIAPYKWLTFAGRSEDDDLDFSITFTDTTNKPIGKELKFSEHGGQPTSNYWTNYNFALSDFGLPDTTIGGFKITQLSDSWGAKLYLDEMYLSTNRGESINPALPTPNPSDSPTPPIEQRPHYPPDTNPFVYIVPAVFALLVVIFH
jgi:hypothetical protein